MPLIPPENIRKLEALCFEGLKKDTSGMVWVDKTQEKPYDFLISGYSLRKGALWTNGLITAFYVTDTIKF